MNRRLFGAAGVSAVAAGSRRSRAVRIGLLAIAAVVVSGDEARGQVGVESDRAVLETLYHATGGPNWGNSTNWLSDTPLSEWHGVRTDDQGRVRSLALIDNQLNGPIPRELRRLTNLERLSLRDNELSGPIPPELGQLARLEELSLPDNRLSGPIPPELGQLTSLEFLSLPDNS